MTKNGHVHCTLKLLTHWAGFWHWLLIFAGLVQRDVGRSPCCFATRLVGKPSILDSIAGHPLSDIQHSPRICTCFFRQAFSKRCGGGNFSFYSSNGLEIDTTTKVQSVPALRKGALFITAVGPENHDLIRAQLA